MLSLFNFSLVSLSCIAAAAAIWCCVHVRNRLRGASTRSLQRLSSEVAELTYVCESLQAQLKRLNARVGMREARAKLEEQPPDSESPTSDVGEKILPRSKLKAIARARGLME